MVLKKYRVQAFFLIMLLVCIVSMPISCAADNKVDTAENNTSNNFLAEKNLINNISSSQSLINPENVKKAEELRDKIRAKSLQEISDSVNESINTKQLQTLSTVTLGRDATFTNADCGNSGTSYSGITPNCKGADYSKSYRRARESILIGCPGYSQGSAWAWVGKSFSVSGSGSRSANIRMAGHIYGLTSAAAGGASSTNIDLIVKDTTTGTSYSTTIYSKSCGGVGWYECNQNFNKGVSVTLQAGHSYKVYMRIDGSTSAYAVAEAGSDFGPFDGDDEGECVKYSSIVVDF
jgi:hypothetical protein